MEYGGRSLVVVFLKQNSCWMLRPVPKCFTATQTGVKDVHSIECSGYTPSSYSATCTDASEHETGI